MSIKVISVVFMIFALFVMKISIADTMKKPIEGQQISALSIRK